jgi:hypothetical protein
MMSLFEDLREKFIEIADGNYIVRVEGYTREKTRTNVKPIRWELTLIDDVKGSLPTKFSHIESDGGFNILRRELKQLGFTPSSPEEFEAALNDLIGRLVEVEINTVGEFRNIRFLRKIN